MNCKYGHKIGRNRNIQRRERITERSARRKRIVTKHRWEIMDLKTRARERERKKEK